jgi:hypothetical protein
VKIRASFPSALQLQRMLAQLARLSREITQKTECPHYLSKVVQGAADAAAFMNLFYRKCIHKTQAS